MSNKKKEHSKVRSGDAFVDLGWNFVHNSRESTKAAVDALWKICPKVNRITGPKVKAKIWIDWAWKIVARYPIEDR